MDGESRKFALPRWCDNIICETRFEKLVKMIFEIICERMCGTTNGDDEVRNESTKSENDSEIFETNVAGGSAPVRAARAIE